MTHDKWVRTVTITAEDLVVGLWDSRDHNPIALAMTRVIRPGATLFVDSEEYFISYGPQSEWFCLPDSLIQYASRVIHEGYTEPMTLRMNFPPWAVVTERSIRKGRREKGGNAESTDSR